MIFLRVLSFLVASSCLTLVTNLLADDATLKEIEVQPVTIDHPAEIKSASLWWTKHFLVVHRKNDNPETGARLGGFLDPEYLHKHDLDTRTVRVKTAPVLGISHIILADDDETLLCYYRTNKDLPEVMLLKVVVRENQLYYRPVTPPDEIGFVTPWIMREKLP